MQSEYVMVEVLDGRYLVHKIGPRNSLLVRANLLQKAFSKYEDMHLEVYNLDSLGKTPMELFDMSPNELKALLDGFADVEVL